MDAHAGRGWWTRRGAGVVAGLTVLMVLGGLLRVWPIESRPLWHDEVMTWKAVVGAGLGKLLTWQHHYEHPPLSYLLVWLSVESAGSDAEWALRMPAVLCGIGCIGAVGWLTLRLAGPAAGVLAGALVAFDLNGIILSQQARMYTPTVLSVVLTLIALDQAMVRRNWRWWVVVGTGLGASFATSHLGLILWAAIPLGLMVWALRRPGDAGRMVRSRDVLGGMGVAYATAAVWCSVGAVVMLSRLEWFRAKSGTVPWSQRLLGVWHDFSDAYGTWWLAAAMLAAGLAGLTGLLRARPDRRAVVLVLLFLVGLNVVFVLPVQPHGFEPRPRYVIVMQIPLWIGIAWLVTSLRGMVVRRLALVAVAAAMVVLAYQSTQHGELARYRLGAALRLAAAQVSRDDNVVYYPAWIEDNGVYQGIRPTHTPPTMEWGSDYTALPWTVLPTDRRTWLIIGYHHETGATDAAPDIVAHLAERYGATMSREAIEQVIREHSVVILAINADGVLTMVVEDAD